MRDSASRISAHRQPARRPNAPDISVRVGTADTHFRTNGVADFDRSYLPGTTVALTAPGFVDGWFLVGWIYTGSGSTEVIGVGPWLGGATLEVVIGDGAQTAEAYYVNVGVRRSPGSAPPRRQR